MAKLDRIYDLRRNCLLNELYYGRRLSLFSRLSLGLEVVVVVGSGASGVSGWILWTQPGLRAIWAVIAAVAVLLAALKPILHIDARIKRYSTLFSGYRQLSISMAGVVEDIAEAHGVPAEIERDVGRVRSRYRTLAADDDPRPSSKLIHSLQEEVNRRIPVTSLFYPTGPEMLHQHGPGEGLAAELNAVDVRVDPTDPWPVPDRGAAPHV
jgi:hypothetical protein